MQQETHSRRNNERWLSDEDYASYREMLQKSEQEASDNFDKVMVSLSGGTLAISITFIKQIAPEPKAFWVCILAWIAFAIALTCTLVSFRTTQEAMRAQRRLLDRVFNEGKEFGENRWDYGTMLLNNSAIISFVIGVTLLIIFASTQ